MLPYEPHWYAARESNEQLVFKMLRWFDKYVKEAPVPAAATATASAQGTVGRLTRARRRNNAALPSACPRRSIVITCNSLNQFKPTMINRFRLHGGLLAVVLFALALPGQAQNKGNGGTDFSSLDAPVQPEGFLGKFVDLAHADAEANVLLVQALGAPDTAKASIGAVQAIDMSATTSDIMNAGAAAGKAHEAVTELMGKPMALSDAGKVSFASAAAALTKAAFDFNALTRNLGATRQVLMTAGPRARVAVYAARATPDIAAQLRAEVRAMVAFAKVNNIALAPDVLAAAAAM
jgi:hypothetical protein